MVSVRRRPWLAAVALLTVVVSALAAPPAAARVTRATLLPNLVPERTRALYLGTPTDVTVNAANEVMYGCTPYEVAEFNARRCLRFETTVTNFGRGPLELHYRADEIA